MSVNITTAFVNQYKANVYHLVEQKGSRLRRAVDTEPLKGEAGFIEQMGSTEAVDITSRHMDTPRVDTPHERRRYTTSGKVWADLIDKEDEVRMLIDPKSAYAMKGARAIGRKMDSTIIQAADAIAYTGKDGSTSTAFDTNMVVDVQTRKPGLSASDLGLNVEKLLAAGEKLAENDVDEDEEKFVIVNARQIRSLLSDDRLSSHDYNTLRPLMTGTVAHYAGFNLIRTQLIGTDSNNDDKVLFWCKSGMKLAIGQDIETKITERADKNYSTQVWLRANFGAVRVEEAKVGYIECDTSAGPGA
jgi:hypothetical protein